MQEERELDELEIRERVSKYHQENISMMLTWVGIEDELAAHLGNYKNVLADLSSPSAEDWPLVRAALLHISQSDSLSLDHNRWLGEEIFAGFEEKGKDYLYYLTVDTRRDRPAPPLHPQERFPITHKITPREATYYYSRTALAVLVRRKDPEQAIALLEETDSVFDPRVRYSHPGEEHGFSLERDMDRLPILYERVGRFEDALKYKAVSFSHFGWGEHPTDIAVRRLDGWLDQLTESGGAGEVTRCLDTIYEWLYKAGDADEHQRDDLAECPTTTRQFWAWYYGQALGRLIAARPTLRYSLLDEIEAGEWDNCWHVAGVLFEDPQGPSDQYRRRALKFYNSSDVEYASQTTTVFGLPGIRPWNANAPQPPHLNPQSNLYWALRVGFADAHSENPTRPPASPEEIADLMEDIKTITSSAAVRILHTERNTEHLIEQVQDRLPPSEEFHYRLLEQRMPNILTILPIQTVGHLVDALKHKFAKEWDECAICLCKSVESMFHDVFCPRTLQHPESTELELVLPGKRHARRTYPPADWNRIPISAWAGILRTTTSPGRNASLRTAISRAFPDAGLDAVVNLNEELARIARLRGSSAHDSPASAEERSKNAEELWDLVVASDGNGFLANFCSALGLVQNSYKP